MKECVIEHEDVLVLGGVVDAFLEAFGSYRSRGLRVLARHFGVETLTSGQEQTYPVAELLAGMKGLQEQFGRGFMARIGQFIYERVEFPPSPDSMGVPLSAVDTAYPMNTTKAQGN